MKLENVKIIKALELVTIGEMKKRTVIVQTQGNYPKKIAVDFFNKKAELRYNVGAVIDVNVDVASKEYNDKWYTNITGWKVDFKASEQTTTQPQEESTDDFQF